MISNCGTENFVSIKTDGIYHFLSKTNYTKAMGVVVTGL
jgi:hypothetical protein